MNITFVITGLSTGGAEVMLYKLIQNINRNQFKPNVISLTNIGELGLKIKKLGVSVNALEMKFNFIFFFKFFKLLKLLYNSNADIVQTWMYHADLLGGVAARIVGIRNVVWGIRQSVFSNNKSKYSTKLIMKLCSKLSNWLPKLILSCSIRAKSVHINEGYCKKKIVVIPNGFDLEVFKPNINARKSVRFELGINSDAKLVGLIARNDPQKNHNGFIDAAINVIHKIPDTHFLLAGKGIDYSNKGLVRSISNTGYKDNFHLLGYRNDIPRLMAALDVYASSSSWGEAFPNVIGEAMACCIPCIVTDVGDSAKIVGKTGRVVEVGDMMGLASNLIKLLQLPLNQRKSLGKLARQRINDRYEIRKIIQLFEKVYQELGYK